MNQSNVVCPVPRVRSSKREANLRIQHLHDIKIKEEQISSLIIDDSPESPQNKRYNPPPKFHCEVLAHTGRKRSTGSKPGNNIYGNIGTAKCKRCRKLKSRCDYKNENEACTKCIKAGKSCGKKVLAKDGRDGNDSGSDTNGQPPLSVVISNTESETSQDVVTVYWDWNENFFLRVLQVAEPGKTVEEVKAKLLKEIQIYTDEHPVAMFFDDGNDGNDDAEESDEDDDDDEGVDFMSVVGEDSTKNEEFAPEELEVPTTSYNEASPRPPHEESIFDDFAEAMSPSAPTNSHKFTQFTQNGRLPSTPMSPFSHIAPTPSDGLISSPSFATPQLPPMYPVTPMSAAMMSYTPRPTDLYNSFSQQQQHTDSPFVSLTNGPKLSHVHAPSANGNYQPDPLAAFPYGLDSLQLRLAMQNGPTGFTSGFGMDVNHDVLAHTISTDIIAHDGLAKFSAITHEI